MLTTFLIKFLGYQDYTLTIQDETDITKALLNTPIKIALTKKITEIPAVEIKAVNRLFDRDPYAIIQFYLSGDQIISLAYRNGNEMRKEILFADGYGKIIGNLNFKNLDKIWQDCQGNIFGFTRDSAYQLQHTNNRIYIAEAFDRKFIENYLQPVCTVTDSTTFIHYISPAQQYENYFVINQDSLASIIYSVGRFRKEQLKESAKVQANRLAAFPITLPPVKILKGENSGPVVEAFCKSYERLFQSYFKAEFDGKLNYPSVYSKMFRYKGKQLVFNREGKSIVWFDDSGKPELEISFITDLKGKDFTSVHFDANAGRFYLQFEDKSFTEFIEIAPLTGQHMRNIRLKSFKHIEQCCFKNNWLYFLFQPDFGNHLKKVYSIPI